MTAKRRQTARHVRAIRAERAILVKRITVSQLACLLSAIIFVMSLICLWRLQKMGLNRWYAFLAAPIAVCSFGVITAVAGWREHPGRRVQQAWTVLAIFAVALLGVIRILLPASIGAGRREIWVQPLIVTAGIVVLFLAVNLIACFPGPRVLPLEHHRWLGRLTLGVFLLILGTVAFFSLARRATVLPAQPRPAASQAVLLAVTVIALLAVFVTRPQDAVTDDTKVVAVLLPAVTADAFFGLTRDLGMAVAIFCASVTVLITGTRGLLVASRDTSSRPRDWLVPVLVPFVFFAAGASFVIALGSHVLGIPAFGFGEALGYSDRQPVPFYAGEGLIKGPGLDPVFTYLWHGKTGTAPGVLAMIGHEAGLPCLMGLIAVLALLFFSLARLAMQIGNRTGAALAWGLTVFLAVQCLLAVETLIPGGVPIGEGPPLLSGGWADYLADLIAIGIVIGLSRQPMRATTPVQANPQLSQTATPA